MTKVIKSLFRLAIASAVLAGLSQVAHAATVPSSANVADQAVKQAKNEVQTAVDSSQATQKNSHTTVAEPTTTPPANSDSLGQTTGAISVGQSSTPSDNHSKQKVDNLNAAIASSTSDLDTTNPNANAQLNSNANPNQPSQSNLSLPPGPPVPPAASSTAGGSHWLLASHNNPTAAPASVNQTPITSPAAPSALPSLPVNHNVPFNPLTAGSMILNLAQTATLVTYHHFATDFALPSLPWPTATVVMSLTMAAAMLALVILFAGIVAQWRRSGYAHAPRSANTNLFDFRHQESLRVLSSSSLFWSQINTLGVNL